MAFKARALKVTPKRGYLSRFWLQIKNAVIWYCERTSLHGFHYVTNKKSSIFTRWFFACVSCSSFILCSYLIVLQFIEYKQSTITTTVKSTAYPIWRVRFPSVTICNFNIVYRNNIKNLINVVKTNGIDEDVFTDLVYNLSTLIVYDDLQDMSGYQKVYEALLQAGYDTDKLMAELAQPCHSMVKKCVWQNEELPCSLIFNTVKTNQGYCCSFNYYGTRENAYSRTDPEKQHYQYVGGAGPYFGLRLLLDVEEAQYTSSIRPFYGLNVLVQDGADYPDMHLMGNTLLTAEELSISVTPQVYKGTKQLKDMSPRNRHCLFQDEGNLDWTSIYSYKTCITQCKATQIYKYCGCVPFYYPLLNHKRICTLLDVPCLKTHKYEYSALRVSEKSITGEIMQRARNRIGVIATCECYPQCNERLFDFHTDRAKATTMMGYEYTNMSILNVYFNTVGCIRISTDVSLTWNRALASVGGLIGLCLGGSVISILECFHFFGKSLFGCKNTVRAKCVKRVHVKPPEIYISDFMHHRYVGKKSCAISKIQSITSQN